MKIRVMVVDLELSRRAKRWSLRAGVALAVTGAAAVALAAAPLAAAPLHVWNTGDRLESTDLNGNFKTLQDQLAAVPTGLATLADDQTFTGTKTFAGAIRAASGGGSAPGYSFSNDSDTGVFNSGANQLDFATGGSPRWQVGSSGILSAYPGGGTILNSAGTALNPSYSYSNDGATGMWFPATNTLAWSIGGSERMRIASTGDVGIGTTTPSAKLHVNGGVFVEGDSTVPITIGGARLRSNGTGGFRGLSIDTYNGAFLPDRIFIDGNGSVGIGTASPQNHLSVIGSVAASGTISPGVGSPDIAENIATAQPITEAADVVVADPSGGEHVVRSTHPYDTTVLGVISTKPAILMNPDLADVEGGHQRDSSQRPLALAGRVPVKVTLEGGAIRPGDFLTTSSTPGHAMRATQPWRGGILGTALQAFDAETGSAEKSGKIVVFLSLQRAPAADPEIVDRLQARTEAQSSALMLLEQRLAVLEQRLTRAGTCRSPK